MSVASLGQARRAKLLQLCAKALNGRRLILVSNRGPIGHQITPSGDLQARRSSGSLVTAFSSLVSELDFTWIASAMGEGDRRIWENSDGSSIPAALPGYKLSLRYVNTPRRVYHKYYNTFCNPLLWFLQHYMWSTSYTPNVDSTVYDAWENGYVRVNRSFADAVIEEAASVNQDVCVMVHDYHLYLVSGYVRERLPQAVIQHYVHIPWPASGYWEMIPAHIRRSICSSLCSADIVGFQTRRDCRNFLQSCEEFLPSVEVDYATSTVCYEGRETAVRAYPLSISVDEVRRIGSSPRVQEYERRLASVWAEKNIVRVDRAEPNKNILRGFRSYQLLLDRYPEMRGQVKFVAFLVPSRTHIRQYQRYMEEIQQTAKSINQGYGTPEWQPIELFMENNYVQAVAGMRQYDVLLQNAVIDGMTLVAKEAPLINQRDGVVILSETAGAYPQLAEGVLPVASADVEGTMQAMYQALNMPQEERQRRSASMIEAVEREDINFWFQSQFEELGSLTS